MKMTLYFKLFIFTALCFIVPQTTLQLNTAHAEKKIACSACEKKITQQYLNIGSFKFHPECFVCSECSKPIEKHITGKGPDFYHRACYNKIFGLTCFYCKDVLDNSWAESGGNKYHPSCYEEATLQRCSVCSHPLKGRFIKDDWDNPAHETHKGRPTSLCDSCRRVISKNTSDNGYSYGDGRIICGICFQSAVNDPARVEMSKHKVLSLLSEVGLTHIPSTVPINLVDKNTILKKSHKNNNENTKGFTTTITRKVAGTHSQMSHSIYILHGLPLLEFEGILAHELIHVWLNENKINMSQSHTEGFCNLGVMLVNASAKSEFARVLQDRITKNPDPLYGDGYRNIKKQLDKYGWEKLIRKIK